MDSGNYFGLAVFGVWFDCLDVIPDAKRLVYWSFDFPARKSIFEGYCLCQWIFILPDICGIFLGIIFLERILQLRGFWLCYIMVLPQKRRSIKNKTINKLHEIYQIPLG